MKYAAVLEQVPSGSWGGGAIDMRGIIVTKKTIPAALKSINICIGMMLEDMAEAGEEPPKSVTEPLHPVKGLKYVSGYTLFDEMPEEWKREALDGLPEMLEKAKRILAELDEEERIAGLTG